MLWKVFWQLPPALWGLGGQAVGLALSQVALAGRGRGPSWGNLLGASGVLKWQALPASRRGFDEVSKHELAPCAAGWGPCTRAGAPIRAREPLNVDWSP